MGNPMAVNPGMQSSGSIAGMSASDLQAKFDDAFSKLGSSGSAGMEGQMKSFIETGDVSKDQKLSASELAAALDISLDQAKDVVEQFNSAANGDAALDAEELTQGLEELQKAAEAEEAPAPEEAAAPEEPPAEEPPAEEKPAEQASGGEEKKPGGSCSGGAESSGSGLMDILMKIMDKDGDGKISEEEMKEFMEEYDKNKDGELSADELKGALQAEDPGLGEIPQEELDALLKEIDADQSGSLSGEELTAGFEDLAASEMEMA